MSGQRPDSKTEVGEIAVACSDVGDLVELGSDQQEETAEKAIPDGKAAK
jgi:hypothetical protein